MTAAKPRGMSRERTPFEWALLLVSLAAALTLIVGLAIAELTGATGPADLEVTVAEVEAPASGGRPLEVTIENVGGTSAENVVVEITVGDITREVNLDLVAKGETGSATVVVPTDATATPHGEVVSYSNP